MFQRHVPHTRQPVPSAPEVSEARFRRFLKDLEGYERKLVFERTLDAFLDLYSQWRRTRRSDLKLRVVMLAFELHRLDPGFVCELTFEDHLV